MIRWAAFHGIYTCDGLGIIRAATETIDGFGWQLFAADLQLDGESTRLTVGFGSTGFTDGGANNFPIAAYIDSLQILGPYPEGDDARFALRMATQGGRNWP